VASIYTTIILDTLAFAPGRNEKIARAYINKRIVEMCNSEEQIAWLTDRVCDLYTKWEDCGIPGIRQILSSNSKYLPKDGMTVSWSPGLPRRYTPGKTTVGAGRQSPAGRPCSLSEHEC